MPQEIIVEGPVNYDKTTHGWQYVWRVNRQQVGAQTDKPVVIVGHVGDDFLDMLRERGVHIVTVPVPSRVVGFTD